MIKVNAGAASPAWSTLAFNIASCPFQSLILINYYVCDIVYVNQRDCWYLAISVCMLFQNQSKMGFRMLQRHDLNTLEWFAQCWFEDVTDYDFNSGLNYFQAAYFYLKYPFSLFLGIVCIVSLCCLYFDQVILISMNFAFELYQRGSAVQIFYIRLQKIWFESEVYLHP